MNDLRACIFSSVNLYANESVLYNSISNDNDSQALQSDENNITLRCDKYLMELNPSKCKLMNVSTRSERSLIYKLYDTS